MPATVTCAPVIVAVVSSLEAMTTGSVSVEHIASPFLAVVEVLVPRLADPNQSQGLDALLNAPMGVTVRWASHNPPWLPLVLDTWIPVIKIFEGIDVNEGSLLQRLYSCVGALCAEHAFFAFNAAVLSSLKVAKEVPTPHRADMREWDASAETMAEVATNPFGPSSAVLFFERIDANVVPDEKDDEDPEGCDAVSAASHAAKCIETLVIIAQMSQSQARKETQVAMRAIASVNDLTPASLADLNSAISLAYSLAGVLPTIGAEARGLAEGVCGFVAAGAWRAGRAGVIARRAAAALIHSLSEEGKGGEMSDKSTHMARSLLTAVKDILSWEGCTERLATAAAVVVVSLDSVSRKPFFSDNPPLDAATVVRSRFVGVAELREAAHVRWIVVPQRDSSGVRACWNEEEWLALEQQLGAACSIMLSPLTQTASVNEGTASPL